MDYIRHLMAEVNRVPVAQLVETANVMLEHPRVILTGVGKSYLVARLAAAMATSYGLNWYSLRANDAFHGDLGLVGPKDLIVLLSVSGNTEEIVRLAKHLRFNPKILLTSSSSAKCSLEVDRTIILPIASEQSVFNHAPITSSVVYTAALYQLLSELLHLKEVSLETYRNNHPGGSIGEALHDI